MLFELFRLSGGACVRVRVKRTAWQNILPQFYAETNDLPTIEGGHTVLPLCSIQVDDI